MVKWIYPFSSKKIKFLFLNSKSEYATTCLVMRERDLPKTKKQPACVSTCGLSCTILPLRINERSTR